jgi:hypothetical protein
MRVCPAAARRRLEALAAVGVGHRRAAHLSGLAVSTIQSIRTGSRPTICQRVEQAILGIRRPSLAHGQRVNGYRTRHLLACLLREGLSKRWIAGRLGVRSGQLKRRPGQVSVATALKVQALYTTVVGEDDETAPTAVSGSQQRIDLESLCP